MVPAGPVGPVLKPKKKVNPSKKMKPFHWQVVKPMALKDTLWMDLSESPDKEHSIITNGLDVEKFEKEFAQAESKAKPMGGGKADGKAGGMPGMGAAPKAAESGPQFLDERRAQNVNISIARFKLKPKAIFDGLMSMSDDIANDEDRLSALLKAVPTDEELGAIKGFEGDASSLIGAEEFMYTVAKIPRLTRRLEMCMFRARFEGSIKECNDNIKLYEKASDALLKSEHLHKILTIVLALGNYMNAADKNKGGAYGFQLSTLNKLANTKGASGISFLAFMSEYVNKNCKEARGFMDDMVACKEAARVESSYLESLVKKAEANVKKLEMDLKQKNESAQDKYGSVMSKFYDEANKETSKMLAYYEKVMKNADKAKAFFAEKEDSKPEDLFSLFSNFAAAFQKAESEAEQKKKQAARSAMGGIGMAAMMAGRGALKKGSSRPDPGAGPQQPMGLNLSGIKLKKTGGPGAGGGGAGIGDAVRDQLQSGSATDIAAMIRARRAAKQAK